MAEFIDTSSGFINLAHVLLIRHGTVEREIGESLIQFADGRVITCRINGAVPGLPDKPAATDPLEIGFGDPAKDEAETAVGR